MPCGSAIAAKLGCSVNTLRAALVSPFLDVSDILADAMIRSLLAFAALIFISVKLSTRVRNSPRLSHDSDAWWNADAIGLATFYGTLLLGAFLMILFDPH